VDADREALIRAPEPTQIN